MDSDDQMEDLKNPSSMSCSCTSAIVLVIAVSDGGGELSRKLTWFTGCDLN